MLIRKGHPFRLDLDEEQAGLCTRTAGICRWLWNLALEERTLAWQHGRHRVGFEAQCAELPGLKLEVPWAREAPSHCLQQTLRDLDQAFQNFFAGRAAYPTYRKKFKHDSFRFPDSKQFIASASPLGLPCGQAEAPRRMKLPKLGWVPLFNGKGRHALKLAGRIKSITVSRKGKHWFASVLCEIDAPDPKPVQGPPVGIDLGVVQAITLSTGEVLKVLGRTKAEDRKLARLQRSLSRKHKAARNRAKARSRTTAWS